MGCLYLCVLFLCLFADQSHSLTRSERRAFRNFLVNGSPAVSLTRHSLEYYAMSTHGIPYDRTMHPNCVDENGQLIIDADGDTRCADQTDEVIRIPRSPTYDPNRETTCLPMGKIGVALNGVAIFNPLSRDLQDALACERTDNCRGHPTSFGVFHYHGNPKCLMEGQSGIIGVAFDGFPIYRKFNRRGQLTLPIGVTLDECHGAFIDGKYRYYVTEEFPYFLGCFRGEVSPDIRTGGPNCVKITEPYSKYSCTQK